MPSEASCKAHLVRSFVLCHAVSGFFLLLLLPGALCAWRRPAVARGWRGVGAVESSKISPPPPGGRRESSKTRRVSVVVLRSCSTNNYTDAYVTRDMRDMRDTHVMRDMRDRQSA